MHDVYACEGGTYLMASSPRVVHVGPRRGGDWRDR